MSNASTLADIQSQIDRIAMQLHAIDPSLPTGAALRVGRARSYLTAARRELEEAGRFQVDPVPQPVHDTDDTSTASERWQ